MSPSEEAQSGHEKSLTNIHSAYTLADTQKGNGNEVKDLMVKHFIETLAEVALSIASRKNSG